MGSDLTDRFEDAGCSGAEIRGTPLRRFIEPDLVANDPAKGFVGLRRFEPAVEVDRRLDVAMAEQAPDVLVFTRTMLQIDRRSASAWHPGDRRAGQDG